MKAKLFLISSIFLFSGFSFASVDFDSAALEKDIEAVGNMLATQPDLREAVLKADIEAVRNMLATQPDLREAVLKADIKAVKAIINYTPSSLFPEDVQKMSPKRRCLRLYGALIIKCRYID